MLNDASQNAALLGDENCIELRVRSHLCYKSIINYDLDITNTLVDSPQVRYIEVFDITNPRFNEQIWPVPNDFVKSRFHCIAWILWNFLILAWRPARVFIKSPDSQLIMLISKFQFVMEIQRIDLHENHEWVIHPA